MPHLNWKVLLRDRLFWHGLMICFQLLGALAVYTYSEKLQQTGEEEDVAGVIHSYRVKWAGSHLCCAASCWQTGTFSQPSGAFAPLVRLTGRMSPLKLHSLVPVKLFLKRDNLGAGVAGLENQANLHYIFKAMFQNLICVFYLFLTHSSPTYPFWLKQIHKPWSKNCMLIASWTSWAL